MRFRLVEDIVQESLPHSQGIDMQLVLDTLIDYCKDDGVYIDFPEINKFGNNKHLKSLKTF